uniref:Uncharacterized protein n=1 Tax=Bifidobacterium longum TaxID=216816 RepID=A1IVN4_BIFLN|nr:hypothetical protein [Bifidobacterium longum]
MHDFSGMADAGGMGYPPSPLIGPWPRVFGCGAGVFKHQPFALLVCSIQGPRAIISLSDARLAYLIKGGKNVTYQAFEDGSGSNDSAGAPVDGSPGGICSRNH